MKKPLNVAEKAFLQRTSREATLNRKDTARLVDALRKQMLYQTPQVVFAPDDTERTEPAAVIVRMRSGAYDEIMKLLHKAGGWTMPPEAKRKALEQHEQRARTAFGDGRDYDFSALSQGDLYAMHTELDGLDLDADLLKFKDAIAEELVRREADAANPSGEAQS